MTLITPLPTPPSSNDTASFDVRADAFVQSLPRFGEELNAFGEDIQDKAQEIKQETQNLLEQAQENLHADSLLYQQELKKLIDEGIIKLQALQALKSDSFAHITQYILFSLKSVRLNLIEQEHLKAQIGSYALFFSQCLTQRLRSCRECFENHCLPTSL